MCLGGARPAPDARLREQRCEEVRGGRLAARARERRRGPGFTPRSDGMFARLNGGLIASGGGVALAIRNGLHPGRAARQAFTLPGRGLSAACSA